MNNGTFKIDIPVDLTPAELARMKDDLAIAAVELEELTDEARESAARFREERKELKGKVRNLARTIKHGKVPRPIECRRVLDPEARTVETVRVDTGEVVDSRAARPDELQGALDLKDQPVEFLPGNLVLVETVEAAADSIYEIESLTDRGGVVLAELVLAVPSRSSGVPDRLHVATTCLVKAPKVSDGPETTRPATSKRKRKAA